MQFWESFAACMPLSVFEFGVCCQCKGSIVQSMQAVTENFTNIILPPMPHTSGVSAQLQQYHKAQSCGVVVSTYINFMKSLWTRLIS